MGTSGDGHQTGGSPLSAYRIELEAFQGPLDLLLHLIRKNEVDIYDIPMAQITSQYLAYLEMMRELDLEIASEFLVIASDLIYIKSRMLLPPDQEDDEEEAADPREELVRRLIEYQKYKSVAQKLSMAPQLNRDVFGRPETEAPEPSGELFTEASLFQLMDAFRTVLVEAEKRVPLEVVRESYTLEQAMEFIVERIREMPSLTFMGLFSDLTTRRKIVTVFLGVLEMIRLGRIIAVQHEFGDPISLVLRPEPVAAPGQDPGQQGAGENEG
ncbi:MAG: segregation/condensation protein A [bacterium]|nr:MAG: segregation/condensation protein A [bacterium]